MDQSLFEASRAGNTNIVVLRYNTNAGRRDVSAANNKEIIFVKLNKPCFAELRNQDGFTQTHIAAANGYLDIVREYLRKYGTRIFRLRAGKSNRTPLHCAASRGRVEILREIISAFPETAEDVTLFGETVLHLASKNNQVEAVQVLVELVVNSSMLEMDSKKKILNMKDKMGNSVLYLAISRRQHQAVGCLVRSGLMDLNDVKESGLTALDMVRRFPTISKSSYADDEKTD